MWFAEPNPAHFRPRREPGWWRAALIVSAAVGVLAAIQPWIQVRFERLFGEHLGPPAWQSTPGFTCLCTCALVAVITLAESKSRRSRQAVRPASLLLVTVMALALLLHAMQGPGMLRGVSAAWTISFYIGGTAVMALLLTCAVRCRQA